MTPPGDATRKQLRGSSLLLTGKFIAVGLNFLTQVLIVRYLSTQDYGAFAYALAAVAFFNHLSTLGLRTTVPRFVPIYHEREEFDRILGTIILTLVSILVASGIIIGAAYTSPQLIARLLNDSTGSANLILIMIFLVPVEAIDSILIGLFASFTSPRAIFFRKYLLGPGLKLIVVVVMMLSGSRATFIAYGYLLASLFGVLLYSGILVKVLRKEGVWRKREGRRVTIPLREIFVFSASNLTTDLLTGLTPFAATFFLGYFHDATQVALFRVVLPLAHLNRIVKMTFETLYAPTAARLYAREDTAGLNDLYWRTAMWMGVLSFPVFLLTCSEAKAITVLAYGARYESSWTILALFSFAYFIITISGFNELTLKVVGEIGFVVKVRVIFAVLTIAVNALLIPFYGAPGAAWGTATMMILQTLTRHLGLRRIPGLHLVEQKYFSLLAFIVLSAAGLFAVQMVDAVKLYYTTPIVAGLSLALLLISKNNLRIAETFPELRKLPLARWLLA